MEKLLDDLFDDYKGVILFFIVVMILSLLFTLRINGLNDVADNSVKTEETYYA